MKFLLVIVGLVLTLGVIAALALLSTGSDVLRRWRGEDRDGTVIADSATEFEADVGKPPPGP